MKTLTLDKELQSVENQTKSQSGEIIKREPLEGTPFVKITNDMGTFLTMGKHRLTEIATTEEEVEQLIKEAENSNWILLINVISAIVQTELEINRKEEKYQIEE